jgi:predicted nucleic acid-binding protein
VIVDTSALYSYFVGTDLANAAVTAVIEGAGQLVISPLVIAELDYLIASRFGVEAERAVLDELASGAWEIAPFTAEDLADAARIVAKYADQSVGVTDASLVVIANRYATTTIATLDRGHFEVLRSLGGAPFTLVPAP